MAANKVEKFGNAFLANAAANVIVLGAIGAAGTGYTVTAPYAIIRHIRFTNETGSAATAFLFVSQVSATETAGKGAIVAGTSIAANSYLDWYGMIRIGSLDFIVGHSGTATAISVVAEGEVGFA